MRKNCTKFVQYFVSERDNVKQGIVTTNSRSI